MIDSLRHDLQCSEETRAVPASLRNALTEKSITADPFSQTLLLGLRKC